MSGLFVGLDVGTQSVKLVAYDPDTCAVVASHGQPLELIAGDDGSREQHAQWWIDAIRACFARLEPAQRAQVAAIGVSGQQHGFVPVDAAGRVLAPVKLWCDTSTQAECDEIMAALGGAAGAIARAGNPILAGYTASKLPWTRKHRPQAYAALAHILLPHDYVNFWLTGEYFCEHGDASGTGWLDVRSRRWSPELLHATDPHRDLSACLPPLVETGTLFAVAPAIAAELGIPAATQVSVGGGDNMMAAFGTGAVVPGRLAMSLGTSGTLFAYSDTPVVDPEGAWAAFCSSSGGWLPLICTMNCTVATESVARLFGFSAREGDARIAASAPGAGGLTLLPFLNGERTPDLPHGKGVMTGLDPGNADPANFYRAAMEGATYSLKYGFDAFIRAGMAFDSIVLTGGGANSPAWRQMVADVFGLHVEVPRQTEGAAFGAALQALWSLQRAQGGSAMPAQLVAAHVAVDPARAAAPDPQRVEAYRAPYRRFLEHLDAVRPLYAA
ncbi:MULTISPECIES: xylulokinase [Stenotrophomonas]|uniref:Xylulose kinase n=1 Tax=Stenotrophomonas nitritireducens TaxID=83617 RepID=A0ABR5NK49_9GAMM|nr:MULTISPECIES: xylulokinase [Stenotrophomonas]KQN98012.1 xylulokinase [Stenotrophomonas sp. Leaf70]KRG57522.1 xylulokinase [Stenotrophomonas nitritireducens]